jgi:hypothetical protein
VFDLLNTDELGLLESSDFMLEVCIDVLIEVAEFTHAYPPAGAIPPTSTLPAHGSR